MTLPWGRAPGGGAWFAKGGGGSEFGGGIPAMVFVSRKRGGKVCKTVTPSLFCHAVGEKGKTQTTLFGGVKKTHRLTMKGSELATHKRQAPITKPCHDRASVIHSYSNTHHTRRLASI